MSILSSLSKHLSFFQDRHDASNASTQPVVASPVSKPQNSPSSQPDSDYTLEQKLVLAKVFAKRLDAQQQADGAKVLQSTTRTTPSMWQGSAGQHALQHTQSAPSMMETPSPRS